MASSFLVVLALALVSFAVAQQQDCNQAIDTYNSCVRQASRAAHQGQGQQGQRQNFQNLKQQADQCFTSNGCDAPQFGGQGGQGQGGQGGQGQGGRAGRVGQGNNGGRQCFEGVHSKTKDYIQQCVRRSDPTFTLPARQGGHGGFDGGHGEHREHDEHQGGQHNQQFVLRACKNNQDSANKVEACLKTVFPQHQRPSADQKQQAQQKKCQAKASCRAQLPSQCQATLDNRRKALCQCGNEAQSKRQEFWTAEPSCNGQQQPQHQPKQHDCNKPDPCQQAQAQPQPQVQPQPNPQG